MPGENPPAAGSDSRRRKLRFRSWHRGMREMDLILGPFADAALPGLTEAEIDQYEGLLDISDTELLPVLTGRSAVPEALRTPLLERILAFAVARN